MAVTLDPADGDGPFTAPLPAALPLALELRERLAESVRRAVEGPLGWQPVDAATAALVPPEVRLVDVTVAAPSATPTVLLVAGDDDPAAAAEAARRARPQAVVAWPADDRSLVDAVVLATSAPRTAGWSAAVVRIGGAAGGVGTTTVALALAGVAAWHRRPTLVASTDEVLLPDAAPVVDPGALTAPDLWSRGAPLSGVPDAHAVRLSAPPLEVVVADAAAEIAVIDLGVADEVDVLVCRPDPRGLAALGRTSAAAVVVVGDGAAPPREVVAAVGGRLRIDVPWSHRAARAAVVGRVPAALPGRLVRSLAPLVPAGAGDPESR